LVILFAVIAVDCRDGDRNEEGTSPLTFLLPFSPADTISITSTVPPEVVPDEVGDGRNKGVLLVIGDVGSIFPWALSGLGPIGSSLSLTLFDLSSVGTREVCDTGTEEEAGASVAGIGTTEV